MTVNTDRFFDTVDVVPERAVWFPKDTLTLDDLATSGQFMTQTHLALSCWVCRYHLFPNLAWCRYFHWSKTDLFAQFMSFHNSARSLMSVILLSWDNFVEGPTRYLPSFLSPLIASAVLPSELATLASTSDIHTPKTRRFSSVEPP